MKKERIRRVFDLALKLELVKKMDRGELQVTGYRLWGGVPGRRFLGDGLRVTRLQETGC